MSDETIIVKNQGTIFLGGPQLVKAATGEVVDAETLGGGEVHSRISGVAASVLATVKRDSMIARGEPWSEAEEASYRAEIRAQYDTQGHPYYATARLWDDGIIDPAKTREVLGLGLSAAMNAPIKKTRYGVFRM